MKNKAFDHIDYLSITIPPTLIEYVIEKLKNDESEEGKFIFSQLNATLKKFNKYKRGKK